MILYLAFVACVSAQEVEEGLGRNPPQREEIVGKVKILVDLVAEFL